MRKKLKLKDYMSGKELAELLHRSRLKWNNGAVIQREGRTHSYCMLGQIARHAGVDNDTLQLSGLPGSPSVIPNLNDKAATKAECVKNFCDHDGLIPVKGWVDRLLAEQQQRKEGR